MRARWRLKCSARTVETDDSCCCGSGLDSRGIAVESSESELLSLLLEAASTRRSGTDRLVLNPVGDILYAQVNCAVG